MLIPRRKNQIKKYDIGGLFSPMFQTDPMKDDTNPLNKFSLLPISKKIKTAATKYFDLNNILVPKTTSTLSSFISPFSANADRSQITFTAPSGSIQAVMGTKDSLAMQRALYVTKKLIREGGFTPEQAAAQAGVFLDENSCDPYSYMKAEKAGKGAKGTGGNGYGAGIGSWTHEDSKKKVLRDAGFDENTKIESLSLDDQIKLVIGESQGHKKKYFDALKRCTNLEDAAATAFLITSGVGSSKNWDTHPTIAEAEARAKFTSNANNKRFGYKPRRALKFRRRYGYAIQLLNMLKQGA